MEVARNRSSLLVIKRDRVARLVLAKSLLEILRLPSLGVVSSFYVQVLHRVVTEGQFVNFAIDLLANQGGHGVVVAFLGGLLASLVEEFFGNHGFALNRLLNTSLELGEQVLAIGFCLIPAHPDDLFLVVDLATLDDVVEVVDVFILIDVDNQVVLDNGWAVLHVRLLAQRRGHHELLIFSSFHEI